MRFAARFELLTVPPATVAPLIPLLQVLPVGAPSNAPPCRSEAIPCRTASTALASVEQVLAVSGASDPGLLSELSDLTRGGRPTVCPAVCPTVGPTVCPTACPTGCPTVCPTACPTACPPVCCLGRARIIALGTKAERGRLSFGARVAVCSGTPSDPSPPAVSSRRSSAAPCFPSTAAPSGPVTWTA